MAVGQYTSDLDVGDVLGPVEYTLSPFVVREYAHSNELHQPFFQGLKDDLVMPPPEPIEEADYLIVESTYGDRLHEPADGGAELAEVIVRTAGRGGVVLVPAFAGLGAPYWLPHVRGSIQGLTRGSTVAHITRAALESIALQSTVLLQAMQRDAQSLAGLQVQALRVDGGACANNLLMQMQADLMGLPVLRPQTLETTALGAALLAGLQQGVFAAPDELRQRLAIERVFEPQWSRDQAQARLAAWEAAVARSG